METRFGVNLFKAARQIKHLLLLLLVCLAFLPVPSQAADPLYKKQARFTHHVALLIQHATRTGYDISFGEAYRSPEQAKFQVKLNADKGIGIAASLHTQRLAIDLNLFKGGEFLTTTEQYRPIGEWWESLCGECRWGGRFKKPDANHFSFEHNGIQ